MEPHQPEFSNSVGFQAISVGVRVAHLRLCDNMRLNGPDSYVFKTLPYFLKHIHIHISIKLLLSTSLTLADKPLTIF